MKSYSAFSLDGVLEYFPSALVEAQHALQALLLHPVRWQDPLDWQDCACYYQGVPCHVSEYLPQHGCVMLVAEPGFGFAPSWLEREVASEPRSALTQIVVNIPSAGVWWERDPTDFAVGALAPPDTEEVSHE